MPSFSEAIGELSFNLEKIKLSRYQVHLNTNDETFPFKTNEDVILLKDSKSYSPQHDSNTNYQTVKIKKMTKCKFIFRIKRPEDDNIKFLVSVKDKHLLILDECDLARASWTH